MKPETETESESEIGEWDYTDLNEHYSSKINTEAISNSRASKCSLAVPDIDILDNIFYALSVEDNHVECWPKSKDE